MIDVMFARVVVKIVLVANVASEIVAGGDGSVC